MIWNSSVSVSVAGVSVLLSVFVSHRVDAVAVAKSQLICDNVKNLFSAAANIFTCLLLDDLINFVLFSCLILHDLL